MQLVELLLAPFSKGGYSDLPVLVLIRKMVSHRVAGFGLGDTRRGRTAVGLQGGRAVAVARIVEGAETWAFAASGTSAGRGKAAALGLQGLGKWAEGGSGWLLG